MIRLSALLLGLAAAPALADTLAADLDVRAVTLHPDGAAMTLAATVDLPAGRHEVILTGLGDLGREFDLPLILPEGVTLVSARLIRDRLPVVGIAESPEIAAARAMVDRREAELHATDDQIARLDAPVAAADAQIATLSSLGQGAASATLADGDAVAAIAARVAAEVAAASLAREEALAAKRAALRAREDVAEALDDARQALAALTEREVDRDDGPYALLTVEIAAAGPHDLVLTASGSGFWQVSYDARLDTAAAPALSLDRRAAISQNSGRDWTDVALTLATTSVTSRTEPGWVQGRLRVIYDPEERAETLALRTGGLAAAPMMVAEEAMVMDGFATVEAGENLLYAYPDPVTLRSGAEALLLDFGSFAFEGADLIAVAAPQVDSTAFRQVTAENSSGELLLPGVVTLWLDGVRVGQTSLGLIAPGEKIEMPFGAIETIRLTSLDPTRSEGGTGFLVRENEERSSRVFEVENFGDRDWPLEVRLGLDFTQQDDLEVDHNFSLPPEREPRENANGLYTWQTDLPAGGAWDLRVDTLLTWPDGQALQ